MQAYKLAKELGISFPELQSLPSGGQLRKQSAPVSPLIQQRLKAECAKTQVQKAEAKRPPMHLIEEVGPQPTHRTPHPQSPESDLLRVWEVGRELNKPVERIIDVLRRETAERYGWSPNDPLASELVARVRSVLATDTAATEVRRANAPSLMKAARTPEELDAVRVQVFATKPTPGEKYLADALRDVGGILAYVCTFVPNGGSSIEVDALVIAPSYVAVIEVKDTKQQGVVTPALNGPWLVGDEELHGGKSSPAQQVLRQARVVASLRKEMPALRRLPTVPGFVALHGSVLFRIQPLHQVANTECFAFKSTDVVAAIQAYADRCRGSVTVGQVLALMEALDVSRALRLTREELGILGFPEDPQAISPAG